MKALLVNPSSPNIANMNTGDFDLPIGSVGKFPPLGLMSIAAYVNTNSGHSISIIDSNVKNDNNQCVFDRLSTEPFSVVGITVFTYTFYDVLELAKKIKACYPEIIIVLGGPHILLFPEETLSHKEIDYIVIGEGEQAFLDLLDSIEEKKSPQNIQGIGYRCQDGRIQISEARWIGNLDCLPYPDYQLVSASDYHSTLGSGGKTITMNTSRGCPFHCTFCQVLVKSYRKHSIRYII